MDLPTGGARPHQLPTVNRRHLGSYWAECHGPAAEPELSPHQAAIRGGGCHGNIDRAFRHLGTARGDPPYTTFPTSFGK
eukprot:7573608-Lingulodinium_polyedra.AAC.1